MDRRTSGWIGLTAAAVFSFAIGVPSAWAHDFDITTSFSCLGADCEQEAQHEDETPFKGWANLTVTNTGTEAWGDFHFELFQVSDPIDNVFFDVSSPDNEPVSSQSGLSWSVSNGGHTLDIFFYSDPVNPSEILTLNVYTDNTLNQVSFFGTAFYPTPVPEPSTVLLLASGLLGITAVSRRLRSS